MPFCDRCEVPVAVAVHTEAAILNEHGEPQPGTLCRGCWPDDWEWPFARGDGVGGGS